ncbi:helix-turn-helix domain-containing protein [Roseovarius sp.]|uniref:helix-turn-helix domain-containing protein n=1 Tax=Roseovarius sp. TaxID=1486281 RepID=UPI003B59A480
MTASAHQAKGKGVYKGRRKSVDDEEIRRLASQGTAKVQIVRDFGDSRMTVYPALAGAETGANLA